MMMTGRKNSIRNKERPWYFLFSNNAIIKAKTIMIGVAQQTNKTVSIRIVLKEVSTLIASLK
jgi:DNA repair protein RadC